VSPHTDRRRAGIEQRRGVHLIVEFANNDGSIFEIGPCCGEEDTGERTREFAYTVQSADGGLAILELPPYVP